MFATCIFFTHLQRKKKSKAVDDPAPLMGTPLVIITCAGNSYLYNDSQIGFTRTYETRQRKKQFSKILIYDV